MKKLILISIVLLECLTGYGQSLMNQSESGERFDLILYGKGLSEKSVIVELKENPGLEDHWIKVNNRFKTESHREEGRTVMAIRGLPGELFVGQDIRENYIAIRLRLKGRGEQSGVHFRGAWAIHPGNDLKRNSPESWMNRIKQNQEQVERNSFADLVYPRDKKIISDEPLIDHVELPVRHLKAGVREVRWLEIIFTR